MTELRVEPSLRQLIKDAQKQDVTLSNIVKRVQQGDQSEYVIANDGALYYRKRLYVPDSDELKKNVMHEAHNTK